MIVYPTIEAVVCRACGATYAAASEQTNVCVNCWGKFKSASKEDHSIEAFDRWLARKLILDLKRLDRNGFVGRCEALSHFSANYKDRGWQQQCAAVAVMERDGHLVCRRHGEIALECTYIDSAPSINGYSVVKYLVQRIAAKDETFRNAIIEAINA